jgi:SAM-dependent methyltransferase
VAGEQESWGDVMPPTDAELRRLQVLAAMFDDNTAGHLRALGVGPGWRCLEVGAGEGSMARWLAASGAGPVVATDINPGFLTGLAATGVQVLKHDVSTDPCPGDPFDLIHVRNLLLHLPDRERVLDRLVSWLRPGGWLLAEESYMAPELATSPVLIRFYAALAALLAQRLGTDYRWPLGLPDALRARGLTWTGASAWIPPGGPPGARPDPLALAPVQESRLLMFAQLRPGLLGAGLITADEAAAFEAALADPEVVDFTGGIVSAWGRRGGSVPE